MEYEKLVKTLNNMEREYFNLDLDGYNKKYVMQVSRTLKKLPYVEDVRIYRNKNRYKHYHISVKLREPQKLILLFILRIILGDHLERVRIDLIRLLNGIMDHTVDFIADKKYEVDIDNKQITKVLANYERIK